MLEKSTEDIIRANLIVAAGDLSFRFPNTLEPWTPRMYACLRDYSSTVRRNTLTVLTHLILNDMIKVIISLLPSPPTFSIYSSKLIYTICSKEIKIILFSVSFRYLWLLLHLDYVCRIWRRSVNLKKRWPISLKSKPKTCRGSYHLRN